MPLPSCLECGAAFEPELYGQRRCRKHQPRGRAATGSPSNRAQDAEYRRNRRIVLAGDPPCHWCGAPATTADHLVAVARGGSHALSNLVPACAHCNYSRQDDPAWQPPRRPLGLASAGPRDP